MAVRPLADSKLAGQSSPSLISASSSHPRGIVTYGKPTSVPSQPNTFQHPSSYFTNDQENQIPALQHPPNQTSKQICDLTKEESIESSRSSTTEMLHDIEKSHERDLCLVDNDDNQRILLLETNYLNNLHDNFSTSFMHPSNMRFFAYNWWNMDINLMKYYKNDITFHGPNLYLSGEIFHGSQFIYPLLRASNFDTIDFEYPLKYITCHNLHNNNECSLMTDIVNDSIQSDINDNNNVNNESHISASDEELEKDICALNIKWSVNGTFISCPYIAQEYYSDGSFNIGLHFNWNIDCIENDCSYNVYIFPSHPKNRLKCMEINVFENDYHSIENNCQYKLRIYPQINDRKRNRNDFDFDFENNKNENNKKRKLNEEIKQEFECKNAPLKRFKNKSSNRKKKHHRTVEKSGRNVSVTIDKKIRNKNQNKNKKKNNIDFNGKYRGYFIAIFVPRSSELYPFCTESMNLQPFIRGQIIFYDSINVDKGKPDKNNYQWLIGNIIKTYKKKGKNLSEFKIMKEEYEQYINKYNQNNYNQNNNNNHHHIVDLADSDVQT